MTTVHAADDTAAMAKVLADFFAAVSFPEGARPDYPAMRGLFCEGAQLIKNSGDLPEISTVDEFILSRQQQVDSGELTSFEEVEVAHVTEAFGNVGHRFSTYQKRGTSNDVAFEARGIICTQFIRTPSGWKISSMAWDDERPGLRIPHHRESESMP
jgi:hypothetical protein